MKYFLALLVLISLITGCSSEKSNVEIYSDNQFDKDLQPNAKTGESGLTLGLYEHEGKIDPKRTYQITQSSFTKDIIFGNKMKSKGNFLLLVIDHAKQINFILDKKSIVHYRFSLSPNEFIRIPVEINELSDGFHSINYLIIREPDLIITDAKKIAQADALTQLYSIRVNLLKNISSIPLPPAVSAMNITESSRIHGVFLSKGEDDYHIWNIENTESDNVTNYTLHYGNTDKNPLRFYVITLLDWTQVPISEGTEYLYGELKYREHGFINARLTYTSKSKLFISIMITNPFDSLPDDSPYTLGSMSSMRVKLN